MIHFYHDVPVVCINQAAKNYKVPAELILAVITIEGGRNGMATPNNNGTADYGVMQVNTIWLNKAKNRGYSPYQLQYEPCQNVDLGTWILSKNISQSSDIKRAIGNYHSHTPKYNQLYANEVLTAYQTIHTIIDPTLNSGCLRQGLIC